MKLIIKLFYSFKANYVTAEIFKQAFGDHQPFGMLYGPMISEEICAGRSAFAQIASNKTDSISKLEQLFSGTHLFTESTTDIGGISWSVILKNVYAMFFGMADE